MSLTTTIVLDLSNSTESQTKYTSAFVGCLFAVVGNLLISVSLNVQRYVHASNFGTHYVQQPLWWIGLTLMILGEIGNFVAYGLAPASVVAPLGTVAVISNMIISVVVVKENLRPEDLYGCCFAIIGSFLIVSFSLSKETIFNGADLWHLAKKMPYLIFMTIELILLGAFLIAHHVFNVNEATIVLSIVALIASFTVITAKGVSNMFNALLQGESQWHYPMLYVFVIILIVTSIGQVIYINRAMSHHSASLVVPVQFVLFSISAILSGVIFYGEFSSLHEMSIFMFLMGCIFCFFGVYFIQLNRSDPNIPDDQKQIEIDAETNQSEDEELSIPPKDEEANEKFEKLISFEWLFTRVDNDDTLRQSLIPSP